MKSALGTPEHKHPPKTANSETSSSETSKLDSLKDTAKGVFSGASGIDGLASIPEMFSSLKDLSGSLNGLGSVADISSAIAGNAAFGEKGKAISGVLSDVGDGLRGASKVASAVDNFKKGGAEGILDGLSNLSSAAGNVTEIADLERTTAVLNSTASALSASSKFTDVDSVDKGFGAAADTLSSASSAFKAGGLSDVSAILGDVAGISKAGRGISNIAEGKIVPDKEAGEEGSVLGNVFGAASDIAAGALGGYDLGDRAFGGGSEAEASDTKDGRGGT